MLTDQLGELRHSMLGSQRIAPIDMKLSLHLKILDRRIEETPFSVLEF